MSERPPKKPNDVATKVPSRGKQPTQRGHSHEQPTLRDPNHARLGPGAFLDSDEALPTVIDPLVPTGSKDRPQQFDPHERIEDNRRAVPGSPARLQPAPIDPYSIAGPPPAALPPRAPAKFDPHGRIDDNSRTTKYDPANNPARTAQPRAPTAPPVGEPMRAISMKTPIEIEAERAQRAAKPERQLPVVQMRPMAEVRKQTPARGLGNLAPPRDAREVRSRRAQDLVIWGSVAVIVASIVTLAIWFLAR